MCVAAGSPQEPRPSIERLYFLPVRAPTWPTHFKNEISMYEVHLGREALVAGAVGRARGTVGPGCCAWDPTAHPYCTAVLSVALWPAYALVMFGIKCAIKGGTRALYPAPSVVSIYAFLKPCTV
jgi:hypothetical protein